MTCFLLGSFFLFQQTDLVPTFVRRGFQFAGRWISVLDSLYLSSYMFGRMESIKLVGVLQEAEDADRRACTRSYFKLNISLIPTIPHLLDCLICTMSSAFIALFLQVMGWWDRWQVVDLYQVVGSGAESVYYHIVFCFFFCMDFYLLFSHVFCLFFGWLEHNTCGVCFFIYLCLWFL